MPVSKQVFLAALECRTKGWRHAREGRSTPSPGLQWRFHEGAQVQRLARAWLGAGRLLPSGATKAALDQTAAAIADPDSTLLFEATFAAEGCTARADALRRTAGGWELIEIKSGTFKPDGKLDDDHIADVAYSTAVALAMGVPIATASLVLLNSDYVEGGSAPLLVAVDVTTEALQRATLFRDHLPDVAAAIEGEAPEPALVYVCRHCDYFAIDCMGMGIDDPLFDLPGLRESRWEKLIGHGHRIRDLPPDADLTDNQVVYTQVLRRGEPLLDHATLSALSTMTWPVYYLDFEAVSPAVPRFPGTRPYQKHPFQFSLHVRSADGTEEHHEYLAAIDHDWRKDLAERLLALLGASGSIVVYSNYEEQVLKQLAAWFSELEPRIAAVIARLFDLEKVVKKGYIHPRFRGKSSIKKVLPVMSPSLTYEGMTVAGGEDAAAVFAFMWIGEYPVDEHAQHRDDLLRYCKRDTEAMVHVHEGLERVRKH